MAAKTKVLFETTIELQAGNAAMVDIGKALGVTGANTRNIKLEYDEATAGQRGETIPVVVTVFEDRSHSLRYKTPPTAALIRRALGVESGSPRPGHQSAGSLTTAQLREIAERKMPDLNARSVESAMRIVAGSARSMGVAIVD